MLIHRDRLLALLLGIFVLPVHAATLSTGDGATTEIGGMIWKWQRTVYNNDTQAEPRDPSQYTIILMPEGHLSVRLDCNAGGGSYVLDGSSLSLKVTHATPAACPLGSLAQDFMRDLAVARIAFMRDGELYLDLMYDTGTMRFAR